jgi:plasmid replication initiation protein
MKQFLARFFGGLAKRFGEQEEKEEILSQKNLIKEILPPSTSPALEVKKIPNAIELKEPDKKSPKKQEGFRPKKPKDGDIITINPKDIRDVMELMEVPFVALSKNRTAPIIYESPCGRSKVKISCHPPYYVASIYDWDIILFVASKMQEIINTSKDIPPRTLIVPRHELLKSINKYDANKQQKDLKSSLNRLKSTLIETTIRNEDGRYDAGFGFLDSWGYTERKDVKEIKITLSQWLYDGICQKGSLLKVRPEYFNLTSGLKKFLYRTARKHVGVQNESWTFSVDNLYEKSGSEQDLRKFKHDLKRVVKENNIPGYILKWVEKNGQSYVLFINARKEVKKMILEPNEQLSLSFL